jgi:hypothetical protein
VPFKDIDELLGSPKKQLPVHGRLYDFPDRISAATGTVLLRISQRAQADPAAAEDADSIVADLLDDEGWVAVQEEILGRPALDFVAEGLTGDQVSHIFKTLMVWHLYGQEAAEKAWEMVGLPPAGAPNRAVRRSKGQAKSSQGRGSRGGSKTPAPAEGKASRGKSS